MTSLAYCILSNLLAAANMYPLYMLHVAEAGLQLHSTGALLVLSHAGLIGGSQGAARAAASGSRSAAGFAACHRPEAEDGQPDQQASAAAHAPGR